MKKVYPNTVPNQREDIRTGLKVKEYFTDVYSLLSATGRPQLAVRKAIGALLLDRSRLVNRRPGS